MKAKIIGIWATIIVLSSPLWGFAGGTGSIFDPYLIETAEHLAEVRNHLSASFRQIANIDLADYLAPGGAGYNDGAGWEPIGWFLTNQNNLPFTGSYDGGGYIISNLYINSSDSGYVGLFGLIGNTSSLHNIGLVNVDVTGNWSAALAGYVTGSIYNCYSTGRVYGRLGAGGLICVMTNYVSGSPPPHFVHITDSYSSCEVVGLITSGGLILYTFRAHVTNCYATGKVMGGWSHTGGLIATLQYSLIENSFATGTVSGLGVLGGLLGSVYDTGIHNCYATGDVLVVNSEIWSISGGLVGSISGSSSIIDKCYSSGRIFSADGYSGGLIALSGDSVNVEQSFWDIYTSGIFHSEGGEGISTPEMMQQETFTGWDFAEVWRMDEGYTYPFLRNNQPPDLPAPPHFDDDLSVLYFSGPEVIFLDSTNDYHVTVLNMGNITQNSFQVRLLKEGSEEVAVTEVTTSLEQYELIEVAISWTPNIIEQTYLIAEVVLSGDEYSVNDQSHPITVRIFEGFSGGNGTAVSPYQVSDAEHLYLSGYFLDAHYELTQDIDLSIYSNWRPIGFFRAGDDNQPFGGSFNGNNHTISGANLTENLQYSRYSGIFGYVGNGGSVYNILLENTTIHSGDNSRFGGLVGLNRGLIDNVAVADLSVDENSVAFAGLANRNEGVVTNSSVVMTASINRLNTRAGGLVEINRGEIISSYSEVLITGVQTVGGLVARNEVTGSIVDCYSEAHLSGLQTGGGLAAQNYGIIKRSYSINSSINGADRVGGLVGANYHHIEECFSTGGVTGDNRVGGLAGFSQGMIKNSYSHSTVNGFRYLAGLVGWTASVGSVINCYSTGRVIGVFDRGGLIGLNNGTVTNSFWDIETSGQANSAGGEGRTTAEMMQQSTFIDWDFAVVWDIFENESYPFLHYQDGPTSVSQELESIPQITKLIGNFPNPFNPETTILFNLADAGEVKLEIFNIKGQKVRSFRVDYAGGGEQQIVWDGRDEKGRCAGSGVYLYRLIFGDTVQQSKMLLLK